MKALKQLMVLMTAASEARQALNDYQSNTPVGEIEPGRITELSGKFEDAEKAFRAECVRLQDEPEEAPEVRDLSGRVSLRNYMEAAVRDRSVNGAEAEYNKERGLDDRNVIPWAALAPLPEDDRADAVTPVADSAIQHPQAAPVLGRVFRRTRVSFLGARMPSVASGEPVYPVMLDTNAASGFPIAANAELAKANNVAVDGPVQAVAPGQTIESVAAAFEGHMVSPKRISGRYVWRMEDVAKMPVEGILRSDLREMMAWQLDFQVLIGGLHTKIGAREVNVSGSRNFEGIIHELPAAAGDGNSSTELTFEEGLKVAASGIDGLYANTYGDLRVLLGTDTYKLMTQKFQSGGDGAIFRSLWEYLRGIGVSMEASGIIPDRGGAAARVADEYADKKQGAVMTSRGSDLVVPIWEGITMIRDPYTGAAKGETALTAHMLANMQFLRTAAWKLVNFQLAA